MTHEEMITYNETLAVQKIKAAYQFGGFVTAMKLCAEYMGLDAKEAFERTKLICDEKGEP